MTHAPAQKDVLSRLELARAAAREGADVAQRAFVDPGGVERKDDGSPVTIADRAGERHLRSLIRARFPKDAILGEEFGEEPGTSGYRWVLDPIDGTVSFIRGVPLWGTMIGVEHLGARVAGVIEMGGIDERVWGAHGEGAWHQRKAASPVALRMSKGPTLAHAMVCTTSFDYFVKAGMAERYAALGASTGSTRGWSDCYAFLLLVTGKIDAVVEPWMRRWDVAAPQAIVEAAGGAFVEFPLPGRDDATGCIAGLAALVSEIRGVMNV